MIRIQEGLKPKIMLPTPFEGMVMRKGLPPVQVRNSYIITEITFNNAIYKLILDGQRNNLQWVRNDLLSVTNIRQPAKADLGDPLYQSYVNSILAILKEKWTENTQGINSKVLELNKQKIQAITGTKFRNLISMDLKSIDSFGPRERVTLLSVLSSKYQDFYIDAPRIGKSRGAAQRRNKAFYKKHPIKMKPPEF
jgi:hypothetical protein